MDKVFENTYLFSVLSNELLNLIVLHSVKLNNLDFLTLEVVSRYNSPQYQMDENYPHLFHLRPNICKSFANHLNPRFRSQEQSFNR